MRAESGRKGAGAAVAVRFGRGDVGVARHERVGLGELGGERGLRRVVELHEALAVLLVAVLEHGETVELGFGGRAPGSVGPVAPRRVVARARRCERRAREREDRERDDRAERESPAIPAATEAGSEQQYPGRDDERGFEADRGEVDERRRRGVPRLRAERESPDAAEPPRRDRPGVGDDRPKEQQARRAHEEQHRDRELDPARHRETDAFSRREREVRRHHHEVDRTGRAREHGEEHPAYDREVERLDLAFEHAGHVFPSIRARPPRGGRSLHATAFHGPSSLSAYPKVIT